MLKVTISYADAMLCSSQIGPDSRNYEKVCFSSIFLSICRFSLILWHATRKKHKLGKSVLFVDFPRYLQVFLDSMVCRNEGLPREGRDFKLNCTFLRPKKLILVVLAMF